MLAPKIEGKVLQRVARPNNRSRLNLVDATELCPQILKDRAKESDAGSALQLTRRDQ